MDFDSSSKGLKDMGFSILKQIQEDICGSTSQHVFS